MFTSNVSGAYGSPAGSPAEPEEKYVALHGERDLAAIAEKTS